MNSNSFTPYQQTLLARAGLSHLTPADIGDKPIEQVVGWVEFCGHKFKVTPDVLIPRVETEQLVEMVTKSALKKITQLTIDNKLVIADVGTGSGAIGISLLKKLGRNSEKIKPFLSDISPQALEIAKDNAQILIENSDIIFLQSNLLEHFPKDVKIDLLIANLPYIPSARIKKLDLSVKDFEPHLALDGGLDGLELIGKLLDQAPDFLSENGAIFLELDDTHTREAITKIAPQFKSQVYKDERGLNRFAKLDQIHANREV